jgi:hypothetical protein
MAWHAKNGVAIGQGAYGGMSPRAAGHLRRSTGASGAGAKTGTSRFQVSAATLSSMPPRPQDHPAYAFARAPGVPS